MTTKVHFDGKVFVPDEPVDLPANRPLTIELVSVETRAAVGETLRKLADIADRYPDDPASPTTECASTRRPLLELYKAIEHLPSDPDRPMDLAAQHDHYLYGMPKRP